METLKEELILLKSQNDLQYHKYDLAQLDSSLVLIFEFSSSNSIGLKGWKFFTVTYQFLGLVSCATKRCVQFLKII